MVASIAQNLALNELLCLGGNIQNTFQSPVLLQGFPGGSDGKESTCSAGDLGSIPGPEGAWQPTPVFLPAESTDRGAMTLGLSSQQSDSTDLGSLPFPEASRAGHLHLVAIHGLSRILCSEAALCSGGCWRHPCSITQPCPTLCDPMDCSLPGSSVHGDATGKNAAVGCHFLLQEILLTQGSNPHLLHLLHWQVPSLPLVPPGKP